MAAVKTNTAIYAKVFAVLPVCNFFKTMDESVTSLIGLVPHTTANAKAPAMIRQKSGEK